VKLVVKVFLEWTHS